MKTITLNIQKTTITHWPEEQGDGKHFECAVEFKRQDATANALVFGAIVDGVVSVDGVSGAEQVVSWLMVDGKYRDTNPYTSGHPSWVIGEFASILASMNENGFIKPIKDAVWKLDRFGQ